MARIKALQTLKITCHTVPGTKVQILKKKKMEIVKNLEPKTYVGSMERNDL